MTKHSQNKKQPHFCLHCTFADDPFVFHIILPNTIKHTSILSNYYTNGAKRNVTQEDLQFTIGFAIRAE